MFGLSYGTLSNLGDSMEAEKYDLEDLAIVCGWSVRWAAYLSVLVGQRG